MTDAGRVAALAAGILSGDRKSLARGITLLESVLPTDQDEGQSLVRQLQPRAGKSIRIGVTGAPGVGKSTLIDKLGARLLDQGLKVAVLTIDPSGVRSGGSILGDKTRMHSLAHSEQAFVRPSPAGSHSGGVAAATGDSVLLCEAAGYDVVVVETVGVGQIEHGVRGLVEFLLLLIAPGAGDEVQALKFGILEVVDCVAVTKADGALKSQAELTRSSYEAALSLTRGHDVMKVLTVSALQGEGIDAIWREISDKHHALAANQ